MSMRNHILAGDTQAALLLCGHLGPVHALPAQPLSVSEYNKLEKQLSALDLTPRDLLTDSGLKRFQSENPSASEFDRLARLLGRGAALALAVEKWTSMGLRILGRTDPEYPSRLQKTLPDLAPPILYAAGNIDLLDLGGLVMVGSRDVDEEGLDFTSRVARMCARQGIQVISGGARGVDTAAMMSAIDAGGYAMGVLADSLGRASTSGNWREALRDGNLALVTPFDPDAGFAVGNAMGRNKYIYALGDWALIVSSSWQKGGTWSGATESLKRKLAPVFVRKAESVPEGNLKLIESGAIPFDESDLDSITDLRSWFTSRAQPASPVQLGVFDTKPSVSTQEKPPVAESVCPDAFPEALSRIVHLLTSPMREKEIAAALNVKTTQVRKWLARAVELGKIKRIKSGKERGRYMLEDEPQLPLQPVTESGKTK
jgi:predicted Rossmann fold nucleotide-binding protein DprA/Smf involved in DNA uptake